MVRAIIEALPRNTGEVEQMFDTKQERKRLLFARQTGFEEPPRIAAFRETENLAVCFSLDHSCRIPIMDKETRCSMKIL